MGDGFAIVRACFAEDDAALLQLLPTSIVQQPSKQRPTREACAAFGAIRGLMSVTTDPEALAALRLADLVLGPLAMAERAEIEGGVS